jgi:hypothetical protein
MPYAPSGSNRKRPTNSEGTRHLKGAYCLLLQRIKVNSSKEQTEGGRKIHESPGIGESKPARFSDIQPAT